MKNSILIISAVALLGILAVYAVPLTAKNNLNTSVSPASNATTSTTTTSTQPTAQTSAPTTTTTTQIGANSLKDGSYTGASSSNEFGDVQIKLTISGGKITDVAAVSYPSVDRHSLQISQYAIPQLKQEVIAAQSASIDSVSGASYTSQSYVESLQSAINQAKA